MRLLLPVLPMLPMAQTIDDRQLYYDHDRDLDYKISKSQQVSTLRSNNLRIARETRPVEHRQKLGMIIRMGTSIKAVKARQGRQGSSNSVSARASTFWFSFSLLLVARICYGASSFCSESPFFFPLLASFV
jgi:hypothetical protein